MLSVNQWMDDVTTLVVYTCGDVLTALQVSGSPALSLSSGSTIPSSTASSRLGSEMIGYGHLPAGIALYAYRERYIVTNTSNYSNWLVFMYLK